jgi:endonuclease/exonuclease/phosphatase family metal-dependent hydrolase
MARRTTRLRLILGAAILLALAIGLWLLNVSRPGSAHGCPTSCATSTSRHEGPLRVMSLNILHGHPDFEDLAQRLDIIVDEIIAQDADIVLLQEVPWVPELGEAAEYLAERCGMNYLYLRSNGGRWTIFFEEGSAILSRFELKDPSSTELDPQAAVFEHRIALHATAITPWGDIDVFVTHLTDGEEAINAAQLESLREYVDATGSAPAVIGGDFNAREDEAHMLALESAWIDAHAAANPGEPGFTCCIDGLHADPAERLEKRIDYMFLLPRSEVVVEVLSAETILDQPVRVDDGWQWASDHVGLRVELELNR